MEQLVLLMPLPPPVRKERAERAFMAGVLSLIDVLFDASMVELVERLNVVDDVREALLFRGGAIGDLLTLVEKLEQADFVAVNEHLECCGLSPDQLLAAQLATIAWSDGMSTDI
jgi:c-di-GMP-related signal transduction protein